MSRQLTASAVLLCLYILPAIADPVSVPQYDAETFCKATTAIFNNAQVFMDGCRESEAKAKSHLPNVWSHLSAAEQDGCVKMAGVTGGGSYQGVVGCAGLIIMGKIIEGKLHVAQ